MLQKKEDMKNFASIIVLMLALITICNFACNTSNNAQTLGVNKPAAGECVREYSISIIYAGGITQDTVLYLPCECTIEQESSNGSAYLYLKKYFGETEQSKRRLLYETNAQIMLSTRDTVFVGQKIYRDERKLFFQDKWW